MHKSTITAKDRKLEDNDPVSPNKMINILSQGKEGILQEEEKRFSQEND